MGADNWKETQNNDIKDAKLLQRHENTQLLTLQSHFCVFGTS